MRLYPSLVTLLIAAHAVAQTDTAYHPVPIKHTVYEPHLTLATLSFGFIDDYRHNYPLPPGYSKGNTSGFAPLYLKLEYGLTRRISFAATMGYDAFQYNYSQLFEGINGPFTRSRVNPVRIFSGGFTAFYHLHNVIHIRHLDPFIGLGLSLNNIRYGAYPSGDSQAVKMDHTVTPCLKAGARYYISNNFSLYADAGYDKHTAFSLGVSCRFMKARYYPDQDRDGIPDRADSCVALRGTARFHGCPDSDGDGIPDNTDSCPQQAGPAALNGCPDSDGDGIADKDDSCPHQRGIAAFYGCADSDGDGIPDNEDACPNEAGPADNHGCPVKVTHSEVAPTIPAKKPATLPEGPVQFETGSCHLKRACYPYMALVVKTLTDNPDADLNIDGYADTTGSARVNDRISANRALAVKKYLVARGVAPARLLTAGHGSRSPVASNATRTGRARNRRVTLKLKYSLEQ